MKRRIHKAAAGAAATALLGLAPTALGAEGDPVAGPVIPVTDPGSVAVGDFNRDGRPDLAVVSRAQGGTEGRVKILLADATGAFTPAPDVPAGTDPRLVVVADFNADGADDLAVANSGDRDVSIRIGYGDGSFFLGSPDVQVGDRTPYAMATGDFNGDNREDLAVSAGNASASAVYIRRNTLNNGVTTFVDGGSVPGVLGSLAVGDLNGDAIEDLAAGDAVAPGGKRILGTGGGAFGTPASLGLPRTTGSPRALSVGDFDGDGRQDVVAVTRDLVSTRLGPVSASSPGVDAPTPGALLATALGDMDGDGRTDLLIADYGDQGGLRIHRGDGAGGFTPAPAIPVGLQGPVDIAVADFDGDGRNDVAAADASGNAVRILRGTGPATLAGNLIVNGGFEGPGSARTLADAPAIPGWERTGGMTFARYGFPSHAFFPSRLSAPRSGAGGNSLLWGGRSTATNGITSAIQVVDVSAAAAAIDAGGSTVTFSAHLGGALDVRDVMLAQAEFLAADGETTGVVTLDGAFPEERRNLTTLVRREARAPVPAGTRRIRVTLTSLDTDKTLSSATADNVRLTLQPGPVPTGPGTAGGGAGAAPRISGVTLRPRAFRVAPRGRTAGGTTITFRLSTNARVAVRVLRTLPGRRARTARVGAFTRLGTQGANRIRFTGRIGARGLRAGRYRLVLTAIDAAGARTSTAPRAFRVLPREGSVR